MKIREKLNTKWWSLDLPFHPFLIASFPVFFLFSTNISEVLPDAIFLPLLSSLTLTLIAFFCLNLFIKNKSKTAIILSLFLIVFFSYGHFSSYLNNFKFEYFGIIFGKNKVLFLSLGLFFSGLTFWILRSKSNFLFLTKLLNVLVISLLFIALSNIFLYEAKTQRIINLYVTPTKSQIETADLSKSKNPPDVYYFIFDRYASFTTLKEIFDYDNADLKNYLKGKGFFIAENAHTNYPATFLSLASSLNLNYIDKLQKIDPTLNEKTVTYELIQNNLVAKSFKKLGYKYIHTGSWWEPTRKNKQADTNFVYDSKISLNTDEFSDKLLESTLAYPIIASLQRTEEEPENYGRSNHRLRILFQSKILREIPSLPGPKFVFAHLLLPHSPYVLDAKCKSITAAEDAARESKRKYLDHIKCANKIIKETFDQIFIESKNNVIIVLQADEGPQPIINIFEKKWYDSPKLQIQEKSGILNAFYFPNKDYSELKQDTTPINTFRRIFNNFFAGDYDILKEKIYMFRDKGHYFDLKEVTDKLD